MSKACKNKKQWNETISEIYEGYRDEMEKTLDLEETAPYKFANIEFVEYFERRIERLDTLIDLYASLLLNYRSTKHDN